MNKDSHPLDELLVADIDPVQAGVLIKRLADQASAAPDGPALGQRSVGPESMAPDFMAPESMASPGPPAGPDEILAVTWLHDLAKRDDRLRQADPAVLGGLLRLIHVHIVRHEAAGLSQVNVDAVGRVVMAMSPDVPNRHLMLHLLSLIRTRSSLDRLLNLLLDSPPRGWMAAAQVISPLMQHADWPTDAVFPRILDGLDHPALASSILDLAGHLFRTGQVPVHPASERADSLRQLLAGVVGRLGRFEEDPRTFGDEVDQIQAILGEAVALATSLCDALGLIGHTEAVPSLHQALALKHRRVQCEAAGALARLGDDDGRQRLLELIAEPSARLRSIAYADELGLDSQVDEAMRGPGPTAEAEMALWLSQPQNMGVPPSSVEVIDSRRLLWPSFNDPVDVHLVRFEYNFGDRIYSNVGMAGPAVFSFATDVADLPNDDIYAMYAGWHAEHEDIFTVAAADLNHVQTRSLEPMAEHLERHGYSDLKPELMGFFLDETAGVFAAVRDETRCLVVTDGLEIMDLPTEGRSRPANPIDVFHLFKGRKMLRTFNPQGI